MSLPEETQYKADESMYKFFARVFPGGHTNNINIDQFWYHPKYGYLIFEFLRCGDNQPQGPYNCHPNKYWLSSYNHRCSGNSMKFLSLWRTAKDINGRLFTIDYADETSPHKDEVRLAEVLFVSESKIICDDSICIPFERFAQFLREMDTECGGQITSDGNNTFYEELYKKYTWAELINIRLIIKNSNDDYIERETIWEAYQNNPYELIEYAQQHKNEREFNYYAVIAFWNRLTREQKELRGLPNQIV